MEIQPQEVEDQQLCDSQGFISAHSQSYGWLPEVYDNADGGMIGKSKRLEALKISLPGQEYDGDIEYRALCRELAGRSGRRMDSRLELLDLRNVLKQWRYALQANWLKSIAYTIAYIWQMLDGAAMQKMERLQEVQI